MAGLRDERAIEAMPEAGLALADAAPDAGGAAGRDAPPAEQPPVALMAAATGLAVATIYYNQPLLGAIAHGFGAGRLIGIVPTATQVGYALGILLLVPLGDQVDRRRLIVTQGVGLVLALGLAAAAPGLAALAAASVLVGVFASLAQQILPFAAELARPDARGRTVGTVMSGLLVGILLARTLSGIVGERFGWRAVFGLGAGLQVLTVVALRFGLPRSRPAAPQPYPVLIGSLWRLLATENELRRAAVTQALLFAGFSAFWSILPLLLGGAPFRLGSGMIGGFGLLAVGGVAIAPIAGRFADRSGARRLVGLGVVVVIAAFALMAAWTAIPAIVAGVVLMDAGIQMAMIGNQSVIYGMAGEKRGRFNTVFVTVMFVLGAGGSAAASVCWAVGGWPAVMVLAAAMAVIALLVQRR